MTLDITGTEQKTEAIALALEAQADAAEELGTAADRLSSAHQGARDVIAQLEQQLKAVTPAAEEEIEAAEDLKGDAGVAAMKVVARAMMRVAQTLAGTRANQQNLIYLKQGESKAHHAQAAALRQQARVRRDGERARAESIAMGEANRAAREEAATEAQAEADAVVATPAKAKAPAKRKRKRVRKAGNGAN